MTNGSGEAHDASGGFNMRVGKRGKTCKSAGIVNTFRMNQGNSCKNTVFPNTSRAIDCNSAKITALMQAFGFRHELSRQKPA
jgi:hypothetical protein